MKKTRAARKEKSVFNKHKIGTGLIGLFIISLMILSALNMWDEPDTGVTSYKGIKFTRTQSGFLTYKGNQPILITSNPSELEANLSMSIANPSNLNSLQKVYISYDHSVETKRGVQAFFKNFQLSSLIVDACPEDNTLCENLPLKTCKDTDPTTGVLLFKQDNISKVYYENQNCLVIQGKDLNMVVDKLVLEVLL